jgi:pyruvate kinase
LVWGVKGIIVRDYVADTDVALHRIMQTLKSEGYVLTGDTVVFTAGLPLMEKGTTDTIKVERVE